LYLPGGSGAASYRLNLAPSLSHSLTPLVSYAAVVCRVGGAHNGGKVQAVCVRDVRVLHLIGGQFVCVRLPMCPVPRVYLSLSTIYMKTAQRFLGLI
jgi:hypothetical protein